MAKVRGSFTDFVDFSRASEATYLGSDGLLKTATNNEPRVEYDVNGQVKGLLIEEQRTNLVDYSEDFTGWINSQSTDTANSTTSPDGGNNGTLVTALNTFGSVYQTHTLSVSTDYCLSVYMKAGSSVLSWISLYDVTGADHQGGLKISWSGGVPSTNSLLGNATGANYEDVGNGWYRISVVATTDAVNTSHNFLIYPDNSVGTETVYIYGAQLEQGSFPTSYIPTSGATATRSADIASIDVANFGYNKKAGTVVVEFQAEDTTTNQQYIVGTNTTSARWLYSNTFSSDVYNYDGATTSSVVGWTDGISAKAATSASQSEKYLIVNGSNSASSVTNGNITNLTSTIYIGSSQGSAGYLNGHIKSLSYLPRRLTNTQLQEQTS